jgi:hypothetical protein
VWDPKLEGMILVPVAVARNTKLVTVAIRSSIE